MKSALYAAIALSGLTLAGCGNKFGDSGTDIGTSASLFSPMGYANQDRYRSPAQSLIPDTLPSGVSDLPGINEVPWPLKDIPPVITSKI